MRIRAPRWAVLQVTCGGLGHEVFVVNASAQVQNWSRQTEGHIMARITAKLMKPYFIV